MGVSGSGKTQIGQAFAARTGAAFIDGDDLHPAANVAKMARGEPLSDADRWPWLDRIGQALADARGDVVIGCSALRRAYRDRIRARAGAVTFLYLSGTRDLIGARMAARKGHFMPESLLDSQFATLEPPQPDEDFVSADIDQSIERIAVSLVEALERRKG